MDTSFQGDERGGIRIEIQAMRSFLYSLAFELTGNDMYIGLRDSLVKAVRSQMWNGKELADGLCDFIQRPNLFMAYLFAPEILAPDEWKTAFRTALSRLWLPWGGLSSIDKKNGLMTWDSTGEQVKSYHRGDSWFWINNLAALVLHRLDPKEFATTIESIIKASTKEILGSGLYGHAAEISSASHLDSEGCLAQCWSAATYIELLHEVRNLH
jgi:glycogen debranching enzyme